MSQKKKSSSKYRIDLDIKCPSCGSTSVVKDYQEDIVICRKCGRIIEDMKENEGEWQTFNQEGEDLSRIGSPITYRIHNKGLPTDIDWMDKDSLGKSLSPRQKAKVHRLRKWQKRIKVSGARERSLAYALSEISRMASQLGLPRNVQEIASIMYRKAAEKNLIRGRSTEAVTSATIYAASREAGIPRSLEEISKVSKVSKKKISKNYRFISRELNIHLPPIDPTKYIARFGSDLKISGETQAKAIDIIRKAQKKGLISGKGAKGTAAAAVYIASLLSGEKKTQRAISEIAEVTQVTLRHRYKELIRELNIDIENKKL